MKSALGAKLMTFRCICLWYLRCFFIETLVFYHFSNHFYTRNHNIQHLMKPPTTFFKRALLFITLNFIAAQLFSQITLVPYGSTWKYLDNGSNQGTAWRASVFADGGWATGASELGYDDNPATIVSYGSNASNKYVTTYFRKSINIPNHLAFTSFTLNVRRDDGIAIYVNGTERYRNNLTAGAAYNTLATSASDDGEGIQTQTFAVGTGIFVTGTNVIAVEVHQSSVTSTDLTFDFELLGHDAFSTTLTRSPYLQMGNQTALSFRWRTAANQNTRVELGTVYGSYPTVFSDAANVTEHNIRATGLTPDTKYYYRVGNSTNMSAPDPDRFFTTAPADNTTRKIRVVAFGDCGRGDDTYQNENLANYQKYLTDNGIDAPDAWLLLGDNAYNSGTDLEYTDKFFGIFGNNVMKNHKLYPAPGNHDYGNNPANKPSRAMPYHSIFTVPQNGECGGVASTKQNFYSYDIGNIHFLSLDSYGTEADASHMGTTGGSTLKTWLASDLAANTKKWTVAYWHHAPYTKTSHNSDTESDLVAIRQQFITFLEQRGVDLIINGHSHGYERGYLLKNYTGNWASFNSGTHAVSTSSAEYLNNTSCPYVYNTAPLNHGAVYVVAGSTGASGGVQAEFDTGPMPFSLNDGGMLYFEVEDNRLDAKMLRRNGTIFDRFTIMKDIPQTTITHNVAVNTPVTLTAPWPGGSYNWSTAASTRSINFTPTSSGTTAFTCTDAFGCVTNQFSVIATGTLPVSLLSFDVTLASNNKVNARWSTATESNNKFFTIERSANGRDFSVIGTVNAIGNSTSRHDYAFVDEFPLTGTSYYRLSQTDIDNHKEYLGTKRIDNNASGFEAKTISSSNGKLVLQISSANRVNAQLRIYDINGRERKSERLNLSPGTTNKEFSLSSGIYIWEIRHEKGEVNFQKVIIR